MNKNNQKSSIKNQKSMNSFLTCGLRPFRVVFLRFYVIFRVVFLRKKLYLCPIFPFDTGIYQRILNMNISDKKKNSPYGIRTSLENFCTYQNINAYPLYAIGNILNNNQKWL
jgi:hypothetical protein